MMPLLKARRSPIRRNSRGAWKSRASRNSTRGKSLYAVFAASSRIAAVAACVTGYMKPEPKLRWASCESTVSCALGTIPSSWTIAIVPANSAISSPTIHVSVVRALRHSVGLNTGTALEIASIPVIAVDPEENARSTSSTPTPSVAVSGGLGVGVKAAAGGVDQARRPRARTSRG